MWWYRVQKLGALGVRGYDCYFVAVVEGEVSVDEDKEVRNGGREGECGCQKMPGMRIGVKDSSQEGGRRL